MKAEECEKLQRGFFGIRLGKERGGSLFTGDELIAEKDARLA